MVRNAGHVVPYDKPERAKLMIDTFINGLSFSDTKIGEPESQEKAHEKHKGKSKGYTDKSAKNDESLTGPLVLTDWINRNQIDEAREMSKVDNDELNRISPSHTGFFRVNDTDDSNIFFWYVPTKVRIKF